MTKFKSIKFIFLKIKNLFIFLLYYRTIKNVNSTLSIALSNKKKNLLIQIDHKGQYQHVSPVINLLLNDKNYNNILVSSNSDLKFLKKIIAKKIILIDAKLVKFLKNIDANLKCNFEDQSLSNSISIFLGHGFLVKRDYMPKNYFEGINHFFLYGPTHFKVVKHYINNVKFDIKKIKFWKVGYPNYDDQINNNYNIQKIKKDLFIKNNKYNILYSPAWEGRSSLSSDLDIIIEIFSKIKKFNFIVKLHPSLFLDKESPSYNFYTGGIDWKKKLTKYENKYNNIFIYKGLKINPLFKISKLMITDFSGVALGFMLEKKPVIFLNNKETFDKDFIKLGYEDLIGNNLLINSGRNNGLKINSYSRIEEAIKKIFNNYDYYQKKTKNFRKGYLYNPGKAAIIAYNTINKIVL